MGPLAISCSTAVASLAMPSSATRVAPSSFAHATSESAIAVGGNEVEGGDRDRRYEVPARYGNGPRRFQSAGNDPAASTSAVELGSWLEEERVGCPRHALDDGR